MAASLRLNAMSLEAWRARMRVKTRCRPWHVPCDLPMHRAHGACEQPRSRSMLNWDTIQGQWTQLKGEVKTQWSKLTDDDLGLASGHKDKLVGRIQERYGVVKDEAERQV